jgi:pimeloyl-ACP methyl ester carboxylesterase
MAGPDIRPASAGVPAATAVPAVRAMIEVIDKGCVSESRPVPLHFVHAAWHAAWCWDEHFLSFFADKGYRALAVSLRGHERGVIVSFDKWHHRRDDWS